MTSRSLAFIGISALVIIALAVGLWCGWKIRDGAARAEVAAVEAERDAARKDADAFFLALKLIGEGGQLAEMAAIGRPSKED
jgi:hypothetical protein